MMMSSDPAPDQTIAFCNSAIAKNTQAIDDGSTRRRRLMDAGMSRGGQCTLREK
jgi:hypothetical protein